MSDKRFWLVWSPTGVMPPSHKHPSEQSAITEAERLARERRGHEFYVMEGKFMAKTNDVQLVDLTTGEDIPF